MLTEPVQEAAPCRLISAYAPKKEGRGLVLSMEWKQEELLCLPCLWPTFRPVENDVKCSWSRILLFRI